MISFISRRVGRLYSRYRSAPANGAVMRGLHPVSSRKVSRYSVVASRASSVSSAAVRLTEKNAEGIWFNAAACLRAQVTISR
jgi:hypothetical protein